MERLKRDKNRVNISSIKKTDITGDALTGGYILKIDKTEGSPSTIMDITLHRGFRADTDDNPD